MWARMNFRQLPLMMRLTVWVDIFSLSFFNCASPPAPRPADSLRSRPSRLPSLRFADDSGKPPVGGFVSQSDHQFAHVPENGSKTAWLFQSAAVPVNGQPFAVSRVSVDEEDVIDLVVKQRPLAQQFFFFFRLKYGIVDAMPLTAEYLELKICATKKTEGNG